MATPPSALNTPPTPALPEHRAMFARVLAAWAGDLIELRRRGLHRPGFRHGAWYRAGIIAAPPPSSRARAEAA